MTFGADRSVANLVATLGGSPSPNGALDWEDDKARRKRLKHEVKMRHDAERQPQSFERFRILMETVDQGRRVVDMADHKARYALIIIGVLNAAVFILMAPGHLLSSLPGSLRPWVLTGLTGYAVVTFLFMMQAIDCLRPRELHYRSQVAELDKASPRVTHHRPLGLLYWETVANRDLVEYGKAWSVVRMEQLNSELVVISHQLAGVIEAKYAALNRLYIGLTVLVALAALVTAVTAIAGA